MKGNFLWRISVVTMEEAEEAVQECLETVLQKPASIYTEARMGRVTVSVYLSKRSEFSERRREELAGRLFRLKQAGWLARRPRIHVQRLEAEDWAESWKRHFKPFEVGTRLLIKPGWSKRRPRRGQAVVRLDPGLSFGTGQHPTTRFCLETLVTVRNESVRQSFLDLGTGSGILAIAAAKLGYQPVAATDSDLAAIRIARENARQNGVGNKIHFGHRDLRHGRMGPGNGFTVVCANLVADLLLEQRGRIIETVAPGGWLALAGILRKQFRLVRRSYETSGLKLVRSKAEGEWQSGCFVRRRFAARIATV